jgi:putative membrane protein
MIRAFLSSWGTQLVLIGLPEGLIPRVGWLSIGAAVAVTFFGVIVETTAGVVENPFGTDSNQLDLDNLCTVIRNTTREALIGPR